MDLLNGPVCIAVCGYDNRSEKKKKRRRRMFPTAGSPPPTMVLETGNVEIIPLDRSPPPLTTKAIWLGSCKLLRVVWGSFRPTTKGQPCGWEENDTPTLVSRDAQSKRKTCDA